MRTIRPVIGSACAAVARRRVRAFLAASTLALLGVTRVSPATAQTFEVVQAFTEIPKYPTGQLLAVGDGVLYGTAAAGGAFSKGAVFILVRAADGTWTSFTIHSFSGPDGAYPVAGLILGADGNLYGTTFAGGSNNLGTVYKMTPLGSVRVLHSFSGQDGAQPFVNVVQAADGTFWGTTYRVPNQLAVIFQITGTGAFVVRATIPSAESPLIQATDGNFYGIGGDTAYRITPSGDLTVIHEFGPLFVHPIGGLVEGPDGNLYGVTDNDGLPGAVLFKLTFDGELTVVHTFANNEGNPFTSLTLGSDGNFYGGATAAEDTVFKTDTAGNFVTLTSLSSFGELPSALTEGRDGLLYGTTFRSPVSTPTRQRAGFGSVFSMTKSGTTALVHAFVSDEPVHPDGRLLEDGGSLFGTSCRGGLYDVGTIFRLTAGVMTTLHSFSFDDGICPVSGLIRGPDGAFYGTTAGGGSFPPGGLPGGTLFRITSDGNFTTLHSFEDSTLDLHPLGLYPFGRMVVGADGNLYGTTSEFSNGGGTVFRAAVSGTVTVLHDFTIQNVPGWFPVGNVLLATDGNFYGSTFGVVDMGVPCCLRGTTFRMTPDGSVSNLHLFSAEGGNVASLMQAADGNLYGTSSDGGAANAGFIFKSTLQGATSVVHEFTFGDGSMPFGELVDSGDGGLYGTTAATSDPVKSGFGTVFKLSADGTLTTLHQFNWLDGANPFAGVIRASDGALYGTAQTGTLGGGGAIFRIFPGP